MRFKKFLLTLLRPVWQLIVAILWQLVWLVPVGLGIWYIKRILPAALNAHFGVDQARDRLVSLEQFVDVIKSAGSLTSPSFLMNYMSAQFSKFAVTVQLHTALVTTQILESICLWGLNLLGIIAVIYAVIRVFRHFRSRVQTDYIATSVSKKIRPDIEELKEQIILLQQQVQELRHEYNVDKE